MTLRDKLVAAIDEVFAEESGDWLDKAVPLIQKFEGLHEVLPDGSIRAYADPATGGEPFTIGWGSTGPDINKDTVWTREQADERFKRDVAHFGNGVEDALGGAPTTDGQMAAMVSLAYNIGLGAFRKSTLLKKHKAGDYEAAKAEFARWKYANSKVLPGLVIRRAKEAEVYAS